MLYFVLFSLAELLYLYSLFNLLSLGMKNYVIGSKNCSSMLNESLVKAFTMYVNDLCFWFVLRLLQYHY